MRSSGSVKAAVYYRYFSSGGGLSSLLLCVVTNILCQVLYSGSDLWLSHWTSQEELKIEQKENNSLLPLTSNETINVHDLQGPGLGHDHFLNLGVFSALVLALLAFSMIRSVHFFSLCAASSVVIHNSVLTRILRAPVSFFHTNPVGAN